MYIEVMLFAIFMLVVAIICGVLVILDHLKTVKTEMVRIMRISDALLNFEKMKEERRFAENEQNT